MKIGDKVVFTDEYIAGIPHDGFREFAKSEFEVKGFDKVSGWDEEVIHMLHPSGQMTSGRASIVRSLGQ